MMDKWFVHLTRTVCEECGLTEPPNSCNANRYMSGEDSVGWHADDEDLFDGIGRDTLVLSLSLGASRTFRLRRKGDDNIAVAHIVLNNGDHCTNEGSKVFMKFRAEGVDLVALPVHPTGLVHPGEPKVFNCLPFNVLVDERIFCVHEGLSPAVTSLDQTRRIVRPTDVPDTGMICDFLWADPDKDIAGLG